MNLKKDKKKFYETGLMSYKQKHEQFVSLVFAKNELYHEISCWKFELKNCGCEVEKTRINEKIAYNEKLLKFVDKVLTYPHMIEHLFFENVEGEFFLDNNFCVYHL